MKNTFARLASATAIVMALSAAAFAGTSTTTANNLSTTLQVKATVNTAISFKLQTSTTATACTISAGTTTDFQMNMGSMDALNLSTASACVNSMAPSSGTGRVYATNYDYVARFSGFNYTSPSPKLQAYYSSTVGSNAVQVMEGPSTAVTTASQLAALSTNSASPTSLATSISSSSTPVTRTLALQVFEYNASTTGSNDAFPGSAPGAANNYSATVTFVLTPQ